MHIHYSHYILVFLDKRNHSKFIQIIWQTRIASVSLMYIYIYDIFELVFLVAYIIFGFVALYVRAFFVGLNSRELIFRFFFVDLQFSTDDDEEFEEVDDFDSVADTLGQGEGLSRSSQPINYSQGMEISDDVYSRTPIIILYDKFQMVAKMRRPKQWFSSAQPVFTTNKVTHLNIAYCV